LAADTAKALIFRGRASSGMAIPRIFSWPDQTLGSAPQILVD